MRWVTTPRVLSAVSAACLVALVALGVEFVVNADPDPSSSTGPVRGGGPAPSAVPTGSPTGIPTAMPSVMPTAPTPSISASLPATGVTRRPTARPSATPTPTAQPSALPPPSVDFRLTSFNMLGASHTGPGGNHRGFAVGTVRAVRAAELLRRHRSDVIGFQELQTSQLRTLQQHTGLDFFPGAALGHLATENSIGWRRDRWTAVERRTVQIPYFDGGPRAMPVVRLRNRTSGLEAWFANFHNPAETARFHHQQRFRRAATRIESTLASQLITRTGLPVFVTGDMNERAAYFCRFTARAPMLAARGGTNNGRCLPGRPRAVDWIFGSQGVDFLAYGEDRSHLVDITTDHPVVTALVRITGTAANPGTLGLAAGGSAD